MGSQINTISFKTPTFWLTQLLSSLKGSTNMHKDDPSDITHVAFQETFDKVTHQNPRETKQPCCKAARPATDKRLEDGKQSKLAVTAMVEDDRWNSTGFCTRNCCVQLGHKQHGKAGDSSDMGKFADDTKIFKAAKMKADWTAEKGFVVNQ